MRYAGPLDFLPLWALFLLTLALVLISIEAGFRLGRRRAESGDPERESSVGAMANASIALLAFLLAFTFGFAASRVEARRTVFLDEVNAIGTAYLRAATLADPERDRARALLREYASVRLAAARSQDVDVEVRRSLELQAQLFDQAAALARREPGSIVLGLYLQSLNEMIDLHTTRLTESLRVRVPAAFWLVLYGITGLAMMEMGYQTGLGGRRRPLSTPAFAVAFAAVVFLIADLDRPQSGWIRVSQEPLAELLQSMEE